MITSAFITALTEEEKGIMHLILVSSFRNCGYEPSFNCVKFLRKDILLKIFPAIKNQIKDDHVLILENLEKKIAAEI